MFGGMYILLKISFHFIFLLLFAFAFAFVYVCVCDTFILARALFRGPLGECAGLIRMVLSFFIIIFFLDTLESCVCLCVCCVCMEGVL